MARAITTLSESTLAGIGGSLDEMIKAPKGTPLPQSIAHLKPRILSALDAGYTYEEIAEAFSKWGVKIAVSTLKQHLAISQKKGRTKANPLTKVKQSDPVPQIEPEAAQPPGEKPQPSPAPKPSSVTRGKFAEMPPDDEL